MHPVKGHVDFIEAANRLMQIDSRRTMGIRRWRRRVVPGTWREGSSPGRGTTRRSCALPRPSRRHHGGHGRTGHRCDDESPIGASNVEALPLTALEMLAVGTPLVAYASGGMPELVGECAVLVPTGDIGGLARALISLADDADTAGRLSRCGPKRVADEFSLGEMVQQMVDVLRRRARLAEGTPHVLDDLSRQLVPGPRSVEARDVDSALLLLVESRLEVKLVQVVLLGLALVSHAGRNVDQI